MNTQITVVFILTFLVSCLGHRTLTTEYDEQFEIICTEPELLTNVNSTYSNVHEHRKWDFTCDDAWTFRVSSQGSECIWSGHINNYGQPIMHHCHQNGFIQGIRSVPSNDDKFKGWEFYCCSYQEYSVTDCYNTGKLNQFHGSFEFHIPDRYVLSGISSSPHSEHEDSIFRFELCRLKKVNC